MQQLSLPFCFGPSFGILLFALYALDVSVMPFYSPIVFHETAIGQLFSLQAVATGPDHARIIEMNVIFIDQGAYIFDSSRNLAGSTVLIVSALFEK